MNSTFNHSLTAVLLLVDRSVLFWSPFWCFINYRDIIRNEGVGESHLVAHSL